MSRIEWVIAVWKSDWKTLQNVAWNVMWKIHIPGFRMWETELCSHLLLTPICLHKSWFLVKVLVGLQCLRDKSQPRIGWWNVTGKSWSSSVFQVLAQSIDCECYRMWGMYEFVMEEYILLLSCWWTGPTRLTAHGWGGASTVPYEAARMKQKWWSFFNCPQCILRGCKDFNL